MKKPTSIILSVIVSCAVFCFILLPLASDAQQGKSSSQGVQSDSVGLLENIAFQKMKGKERIVISLTKKSPFKAQSMAGKTLSINVENAFVPEDLRKPLGEGQLDNVMQALADQKTMDGKQWISVSIDLKERVPYSVRQDGRKIILDFNVASLERRAPVTAQRSEAVTDAAPVSRKFDSDTGTRQAGKYTGQKITVDFQDANIKSVLRLLAEVSGKNIVAGEDVKGTMSITMKNVPWDQALDTVLSLQGLAKVESGNVISVMTSDRLRKEVEDRRKAEEAIIAEEKKRKEEEVKLLSEQGKLRQISIEAKIVEASDEFVRNLGVRWGGNTNQLMSSGDYAYGLSGGSNIVQSRQMTYSYPSGIGYVDATTGKALTMAAVNMPASLAAPTLGFVIGGANAVLEAQIQALETTSQGKIISSPKVTTMDNVKAVIEQGEDVPYVTPASASSPATVNFKKATLKLEVKPTITTEGKVSMEILATNDIADYTKAAQLQGNPPIKTSRVESKVVLNDGDTLVIGGVLKTEDTKGVTGIPWLSKIPILGWLFKEEDVTKKRRQLLIFVTPKIMKQDGSKVAERI